MSTGLAGLASQDLGLLPGDHDTRHVQPPLNILDLLLQRRALALPPPLLPELHQAPVLVSVLFDGSPGVGKEEMDANTIESIFPPQFFRNKKQTSTTVNI